MGLQGFISGLDSRSCGVVILFNNTFEYSLHNAASDQVYCLDISIFYQRCTLVARYGPNKDSPGFFQSKGKPN